MLLPQEDYAARGCPLRMYYGPELVAQAVQDRLAKNGCGMIYIEPGSPWQNPHIESFHGRFGGNVWTGLRSQAVGRPRRP